MVSCGGGARAAGPERRSAPPRIGCCCFSSHSASPGDVSCLTVQSRSRNRRGQSCWTRKKEVVGIRIVGGPMMSSKMVPWCARCTWPIASRHRQILGGCGDPFPGPRTPAFNKRNRTKPSRSSLMKCDPFFGVRSGACNAASLAKSRTPRRSRRSVDDLPAAIRPQKYQKNGSSSLPARRPGTKQGDAPKSDPGCHVGGGHPPFSTSRHNHEERPVPTGRLDEDGCLPGARTTRAAWPRGGEIQRVQIATGRSTGWHAGRVALQPAPLA